MRFLTAILPNKNSIQTVYLNALFLIGLLFTGQVDAMAVVFAYVFETIIIGIAHVFKLCLIIWNNPAGKEETKITNFLMIPFFMLHYGFFVAIQSVFLYLGFAIKDDRFSTSLSVNNFISILELEGFYWVVISLILSHLMSFYFNFYKTKKYVGQTLSRYFIKPYLRIFVQQFLAIVPFFFLFFYDQVGNVAALLLIGLRVLLDCYLNSIANNPDKLKKLALSLVKNDKEEELPEIEKTLQAFFEE